MSRQFTRRQALQAGAAAGVSALTYSSLIAQALANPPSCGSLKDIQHVVILIQENRSFDHYFGSYRGVTGFADPNVLPLNHGSGLSIFAQPGYPGGFDGNHLCPFHLDSFNNGECTNDINHSWGPQHTYWDNGALDGFVTGHLAADGSANGPLTMGYYTRNDLSFYYALAGAFTICDHYFCSVIGPTDPNRLYSMSGTLDPSGSAGPILSTSSTTVERFNTLSWTTMPEQLQTRGISWKVYGDPDGNYGDNVLPYFKQYWSNPVLTANALVPTYPGTFQADVLAGTLPQVSWILAPLVNAEHPPAPEIYGGRQRAEHAGLEPERVVQDRAVHHPRRERRLLRSRASGHGAGGHTRRVPNRQPAPVGCERGGRADRTRLPRAADDRLAVRPRRTRQPRRV